MDSIRDFLEDYGKRILIILAILVALFGVALLLLELFKGEGDDLLEPGEELTEEDYELGEDEYSGLDTKGLITQDNYSSKSDEARASAESETESETEESKEDEEKSSAVKDIAGDSLEGDENERALYDKLNVSEESQSILDKYSELISKHGGTEVKGEGSPSANYTKLRGMVEDGHGCGENTTFEDCLYTVIGEYQELLRAEDDAKENVDKVLGDLSTEIKQQRGVLTNYKNSVGSSNISEETVKTNLTTTADMLITANAMQQEAVQILSSYGEYRDKNGELEYDDVVKLREEAHLLHNDIEQIYSEVNRYLINVGNQIQSFE